MRVIKVLLFGVVEFSVIIGFGIKFFEAYLVCSELSDFVLLGFLFASFVILIFWLNVVMYYSKILK